MDYSKTIAVVGIGGIFPGADTPDLFWDNIKNKICSSQLPPDGRWAVPCEEAYSKVRGKLDRVISKKACFVNGFTLNSNGLKIDPLFLEKLDPLFHYLLHAGKEAFFDAETGQLDLNRVGIVVGNIALPTEKSSALAVEFLGKRIEESIKRSKVRAEPTHPANRYVTGLPAGILAKSLGLGGGTMTIDAACASSLYAIRLASEKLLTGKTDAMLAGGVSRPDSFYTQMGFSQLHALSPDGISSPFDISGNGLVVGEGAGLFLLKRAEDAIKHNDKIYALIRSTGLSNDVGGGLLAPDSDGQIRAMEQAFKYAGIAPSAIDLVECHATGTPLGDSVEFRSLNRLWGKPKHGERTCVLGSVKSNIGHLLTAAGAAGLMKVLLSLKNKTLPPTANFVTPSKQIALSDSPFRVLKEAEPWRPTRKGEPRRAAVSAFGFGGINAHLIVEEWIGKPDAPRREAVTVGASTGQTPIAVVGMGADFGEWDSLDKFSKRVIGGKNDSGKAAPRTNWWGVDKSGHSKMTEPDLSSFKGFFKKEVKIPSDTFRIPPKELEEMLPQQSLMLKVAAAAIEDAGISERYLLHTGVFIGIALDMNTTNFHLRWRSGSMAAKWAAEAGIVLSEQELAEWSQLVTDAAGVPLTANRTIGSLGSIIASRIAREFKFGGPAFTISSEETSAFSALETAAALISQGSIRQAVVGAVDLPGDVRSIFTTHQLKKFSKNNRLLPFGNEADGTMCGEGAGAVVLKSLEDAKKNGDRIYAVLRGVGSASGGSIDGNSTDEPTYLRATEEAYKYASLEKYSATFIEANGSGYPEDDRMEASALNKLFKGARDSLGLGKKIAVGSVKADIGETQAASGIAGVIKTALCLFHEIIPSIRGAGQENLFQGESLYNPSAPQYWLHNASEGKRVAGVSGISISGNASHVVLEEPPGNGSSKEKQHAGLRETGLFVIRGGSPDELISELQKFEKYIAKSTHPDLDSLAGRWFQSSAPASKKGCSLTLLANSFSDLKNIIKEATRLLKEGDLSIKTEASGIFFNPDAQSRFEKIAFVYPGSGNHFLGMGREISLHFSELLRTQAKESNYLKSQYQPDIFWNRTSTENSYPLSTAALLGQVAVGTLYTDLLTSCGIRPNAVIGYSLGETSGFFSLKAWRDRDGMLQRISKTPLFQDQLAGDFHAAQEKWKSPGKVNWVVGVVDRAEGEVLKAINKKEKVYLLIVNTPNECIIGGEKEDVEKAVQEMGGRLILLNDVTIAHCDVVEMVKDAYRDLHLFETFPPAGVSFYSGASGKRYSLNSESAADSVLNHALHGINFPKVIRQAYEDGVRIFVEPGPGSSSSRMIKEILLDKPHKTVSLSLLGVNEWDSLLALLAGLIVENVPVDLSFLYGGPLYRQGETKKESENSHFLSISTEGRPFDIPLPMGKKFEAPSPPPLSVPTEPEEVQEILPVSVTVKKEQYVNHFENSGPDEIHSALAASIQKTSSLRVESHEQFLRFSTGVSAAMERNISLRMDILKMLEATGFIGTAEAPGDFPLADTKKAQPVFLDRSMCMEFAVGRIGAVLGEKFSEIDTYPTRVRLPDEPLMLVDRILSVEGEALSMTGGKIVTEHDIHQGSWYLDCNRIPTCIAVESGQADLLLTGFLGIDFKTRGLSMYRLLDAVVTFHREMPGPGKTIRYDIAIDHFFRQGDTYLFRFSFEASVEGEPLLTMREGCAGFFSQKELDAGRGIVKSAIEKKIEQEIKREQAERILPMAVESYTASQLEALRRGDLYGCFGAPFSDSQVKEPVVIPGGRMALVHRITSIDPNGGRFSQGMVSGEADIKPDDWFLTCHFVDDKVMPGTLMFECCLHTLRVYLLRMGWVFEKDEVTVEPVPGVSSRLKCRGQVTEDTKIAVYEIHIKETGYRPEPYAIVDALMFADQKPIVEITDMSIRFCGSDKEKLLKAWEKDESTQVPKKPLYDNASILAFSNGKPSEAFGDRYKVFDKDRVIARLPGPPYKFLDRITAVQGEPWVMKEGHGAEAEYDISEDDWYFKAHSQGTMPSSVLLEIALQPCGWLAAYMGSALTSDTDLRFRNLGGSAVQYSSVVPETGTLTVKVKCTNVSSSVGMIIQNYDLEVSSRKGTVYKGDTYFGFFAAGALKNQVGIRDAAPLGFPDNSNFRPFPYPGDAPYPEKGIRMIDEVTSFLPVVDGGGTQGFVEGIKRVDPDEWFFKAHFYQDPVCPGSLGLESFFQLVRLYAERRWGAGIKNETLIPGVKHEWVYRGQIIPEDQKVTVQARIDSVDDSLRRIQATGSLSVDGRLIYQMKNFGIQYE